MSGESISLDDLLTKQNQPARLLATVEAIPGDDERVTVTPFIPGLGCACSRSLRVSRAALAQLVTTDDVHACCGKRLMVVEVSFVDSVLTDIFQQQRESAVEEARSSAAAVGRQFDPQPENLRPQAAASPAFGPGSRGFFPREAHSTTEELGSGWWSQIVCSARYGLCMRGCEHTPYFLDPVFRARCECECDNEYTRCLDPHANQRNCSQRYPYVLR